MAKSWASIYDEAVADFKLRKANSDDVDASAWRDYWVGRYPHFEQKFDSLYDLILGSPGPLVREVKLKNRLESKPIRLLHISDLHFSENSSPNGFLQPMLQDLRRGEHLGFDSVDYLVISGDFTDKGGEPGFEKAYEFVTQLIGELSIPASQCVFVPGNHDVQDTDDAYRVFFNDSKARLYNSAESTWHREGSVILLADKDKYNLRLECFSKMFYSRFSAGVNYPLEPAKQGIVHDFPDTGLQFLSLNSAWQIDRFHRKRSSIHHEAVSDAISLADSKIIEGRNNLRIAVWHHAVQGAEAMQNDEFLTHLRNAGVKLCLHGDVHEIRRGAINQWDKGGIKIVGVGSFSSEREGRPESTPRHYNVLEIEPDFSSVRVHTRERRKPESAWQGYHEWPDPSGGSGRVPFFDIVL